MSASIKVQDLRKSFGSTTVLHSVDLDVAEGEIVTILGQSGGGKSTLLRCINLLEVPDSGEIHIGDGAVFSGTRVVAATWLGCGRRSGWSSSASTCSRT